MSIEGSAIVAHVVSTLNDALMVDFSLVDWPSVFVLSLNLSMNVHYTVGHRHSCGAPSSTVCVRRARWHVAGATPGKKRYSNYLSCKTTNTMRILQLLNYELRSLNLEIHGPLVGRLVACHCGSRCSAKIPSEASEDPAVETSVS